MPTFSAKELIPKLQNTIRKYMNKELYKANCKAQGHLMEEEELQYLIIG
jgi:hypothetical protein